MISVQEAERTLAANQMVLPEERVALRASVGRILREDVVTDRDLPPYDRVTMDGIALASSSVQQRRSWRVVGRALAGQAHQSLADPQAECMEVATGAVLPAGCDAVVRIEDVVIDAGAAAVAADLAIASGQNIHRRGADCAAGANVLRGGNRIGAPQMAVLASVGCAEVVVGRLPRVAVVSTGDELVAVDAPVAAHQIRRSNPDTVAAGLASRGLTAEISHLPDDPVQLRDEIGAALARNDVLITTGAVSMGSADYLPAVLADLGVECYFHRVAQRPGRPLWVGGSAAGKRVFALPGNPVSVMACLHRYVLPFLERAMGKAPAPVLRAQLAEAFSFPPSLGLFLPVRLSSAAGQLLAAPAATGGSGDFLGLVGTDGIAFLDGAAQTEFAAGTAVEVLTWRGQDWAA
jgi:molybdopterin molybdotransferase